MGSAGFIEGYAELMEQTMEQSIVPDYIFHATALFAEKEILGQMLSEFETRLRRQGIRRISLMTSRGEKNCVRNRWCYDR